MKVCNKEAIAMVSDTAGDAFATKVHNKGLVAMVTDVAKGAATRSYCNEGLQQRSYCNGDDTTTNQM